MQSRPRKQPRRASANVVRKNNTTRLYAIIIGVAFLLLIMLYTIFFTNVFGKSSDYTKLALSADTQVVAADNKTLYYLQGTTLYRTDSKGKVTWTSKFSSGKLELAVGTELICLYNEETAMVLDNNKNPLFNIGQSAYTIKQVKCGSSSVALKCIEEATGEQSIRVFSKEGVELNRFRVDNGDLLDLGFYGEQDNLWYLTLDTTGVSPISYLTTANPEQQKFTGVYSVHGQLVSDIRFYDTDVYIHSTHSVTTFDVFGKEQSKTLIYGSRLTDSLTLKDDLILAYAPVSDVDGAKSTVRILSRKGLDTLIQLPTGIKHFALSEKYIYCFGESVVYQYQHDGTFYKSAELDFKITSFDKLADNLILLNDGENLIIYTLV